MSPEAQILQPEDTKKGVCGEEPDEQIQRRMCTEGLQKGHLQGYPPERVQKSTPFEEVRRPLLGGSRGVSPEAQILQPEDTKKGVSGEQQIQQIRRRTSERVPKEVPKRDISRDEVPKEVFPEVRRSGRSRDPVDPEVWRS